MVRSRWFFFRIDLGLGWMILGLLVNLLRFVCFGVGRGLVEWWGGGGLCCVCVLWGVGLWVECRLGVME